MHITESELEELTIPHEDLQQACRERGCVLVGFFGDNGQSLSLGHGEQARSSADDLEFLYVAPFEYGDRRARVESWLRKLHAGGG